MNTGNYDAVLMIAFGGPQKPEEIRPFLQHVLRGRNVSPGRLEEVAHHYEVIGGRSPLNELTEKQRVALEKQLVGRGCMLPVVVGMRHAQPFVADVLTQLSATRARRVLGVIMAAFHDHDTVKRYASAADDALRERSLPIAIDYCDGAELHPGFVAAHVEHIRSAFSRLPRELRPNAELVFTAHSVPTSVGESSGYVGLFELSAERIAAELRIPSYRLAYQSRSGSPRDPWLEPDIGDELRDAKQRGARAVVIAPIGFVCDHVEVLYDLDIEAARIAQELGLSLARSSTVNDHPAYIEALAERVLARA